MITWFYAFAFGLSLALLGIVLLKNKRVDTTLLLAALLICINCFGRYLQAAAETLETAVLANRFIYVGACYIPLLMVVLLTALCGFCMPRIMLTGLVILSTVIFGCSMTVGHSTLLYRTMELREGEG